MPPRWIAGYDFSPCADAAVELAAHELAAAGGTLVLVHAYREPHRSLGFELAVSSPALDPLTDIDRILATTIAERLDEVAMAVRQRFPGLTVETRVAKGHPAECLVAAAEDPTVERVVVGTHGHRGLAKFFLGSVAERVLKLCPRPVLVVKKGREHGASS